MNTNENTEKIKFFRGESKEYEQPCTPTLFRFLNGCNNLLLLEKAYYELSMNHINMFNFTSKKDELLKYIYNVCFMQHYGFGTRLLDITETKDVAYYFASCSNFDRDGYVYSFEVSEDMKFFKSAEAETVRRKFLCIKNISTENKCIINLIENETDNVIRYNTITNNAILKYESLFDILPENIRYQRQNGAFIVPGNRLEGDNISDEHNVIMGKKENLVKSIDKIDELYKLCFENDKHINHVYLFPDDDNSLYLCSRYNLFINSYYNQKSNLFKNIYTKFYLDNDESKYPKEHFENNSVLFEELTNEYAFYFFFIEMKDCLFYILEDATKINKFFKENKEKTIKELIEQAKKLIRGKL